MAITHYQKITRHSFCTHRFSTDPRVERITQFNWFGDWMDETLMLYAPLVADRSTLLSELTRCIGFVVVKDLLQIVSGYAAPTHLFLRMQKSKSRYEHHVAGYGGGHWVQQRELLCFDDTQQPCNTGNGRGLAVDVPGLHLWSLTDRKFNPSPNADLSICVHDQSIYMLDTYHEFFARVNLLNTPGGVVPQYELLERLCSVGRIQVATVTSCNNSILVTGGTNYGRCLRSVYQFDCKSDKWTHQIDELPLPLHGHSLTAADAWINAGGEISTVVAVVAILSGGLVGDEEDATVEATLSKKCYALTSANKWLPLPDLLIGSYNHRRATVVDGKLVLDGGRTANHAFVNTAQALDLSNTPSEWSCPHAVVYANGQWRPSRDEWTVVCPV